MRIALTAGEGGVEVKAGSLHGLNGVLVFGTTEVTSYQGPALRAQRPLFPFCQRRAAHWFLPNSAPLH